MREQTNDRPVININQYNDGFGIDIISEDDDIESYNFEYGESIVELKQMFESLGFVAEYEEIY